MDTSQRMQRSWRQVAALAAFAVLMLAPTTQAKSKKVSDYFLVCRRGDPDFAGCVKRSIEDARPRLVKGMPEVRLPSIDPLRIEQLEMQEGQGNFRFLMRLKNVSVTGLKDFTVRSIKADWALGSWVLDMFTPHQHFEGQYEMEGRLMSLPIQGSGDATMDFDGVTTIGELQLKNVTRKGKAYVSVDSFRWKIDVENAKSHFTNLFNGDKTLGETTNKFLNENWRDAFDTYKHLPEEAFSQFFTELQNRFYEQFSIDELYPE
ncbi:hypothetical protein R5R35_004093 [Gryllus longicercus]|uniref:Uncharacterized protein n=1 Tax=Gryllus longicercus TaxID=2509291 RepID=A0AAN9Z5Y8_9ORTH